MCKPLAAVIFLIFVCTNLFATLPDDILELKFQERRRIIENSFEFEPFSSINQRNDPSRLIEGSVEKSIIELNRYGNAILSRDMFFWSGDYWATYKGGIAFRYAHPSFVENYKSSWINILNLLARGNSDLESLWNDSQNYLSPAEKYDLLLGDLSEHQVQGVSITGTLTYAEWEEGKRYWNKYYNVPKWMGHCQGWAAASLRMARPKKIIQMRTPLGKSITFFPSDLKALATLSWANASYRTKFVGNRCDIKNPRRDGNGRTLDEDCFDLNPGTWHMVVINQLGIYNKGLIMDTTYDFEVWNQPVMGYQVRYVSPRGKTTNMENAIQPYSRSKDQYREFRVREPEYIVNVEMEVQYVKETYPTQQSSDSSNQDQIGTVLYQYDLEVNDRYQIIGGEWHSRNHPDFVWIPAEGQIAESVVDRYISYPFWTSDKILSPEIRRIGIESASPKGQPIGKVVEDLMRLAQ